MSKLLVPFDGSDSARRALAHAISMLRPAGGGSLHLVHAHDDPVPYGEVSLYLTPERLEAMQREQSEAVLVQARPVLAEAGITYTEHVMTGRVADAIARCADELGCDGIVMGTRGLGAVANLVVGSVASRVVHLAKVPVTLVK
jgi:nucleotide-binding universal stress UspA family protein